MAKSLRQKLRERLRDREYRHAYADESLNTYLASQLRVLREQRGLSQAKLGSLMGTQQAGISRLESADYEGWSIRTLKKLAEAFDLRLSVSFENFGTLWRDMARCDREHLERPKFEDDPEFLTAENQPVGEYALFLAEDTGTEDILAQGSIVMGAGSRPSAQNRTPEPVMHNDEIIAA